MPNQIPDTFGTMINCIDGRAQAPAADWIKLHCNVTYVDTITTPGADRVVAEGPEDRIARLRNKVQISVERHFSPVVAVVGHFDCLANPCDFEERRELILQSTEVVRKWNLGTRIAGLYVNEWGSCDVIFDSHGEVPALRSYL